MSKYMAEALELAKLAKGRTSPNPLVGAVIVKDNVIVGRGYHHAAGTPHAEVHALREASSAARGAVVYVTLEPCSHYGRTPPCAEALIKADVSKVIIAMTDPNPLVSGRGVAMLQEAGIEVEIGVMEDEARLVNEVFIKHITTSMPYVTYKTALSLDGKIATSSGESQWITSPETRNWVQILRNENDAIMVGINTVLKDDPSLTCRVPGGHDPLRLVVDSTLRLPLNAKIINSSQTAPLYVATTVHSSAEKRRILEELGIKLFVYQTSSVPLDAFLHDLYQAGITSILLEGGSTLAWSMFEQKLIDKVHFCLAPILIGGSSSPSPLGGEGVKELSDAIKLSDLTVQKISTDLIITGYPV